MDRGDDILVISHSLGSMIAYDTLWKFCRTGEYRPNYTEKRVSLRVTHGSPPGDETFKRNPNGAGASGERRFPTNVVNWVNVAAEDRLHFARLSAGRRLRRNETARSREVHHRRTDPRR